MTHSHLGFLAAGDRKDRVLTQPGPVKQHTMVGGAGYYAVLVSAYVKRIRPEFTLGWWAARGWGPALGRRLGGGWQRRAARPPARLPTSRTLLQLVRVASGAQALGCT